MTEHLTDADREALNEWYFGDQYDDMGLVAAVDSIVARHRAEAAALALRNLANDIDPTGYGWTDVVSAKRFQSRINERADRIEQQGED